MSVHLLTIAVQSLDGRIDLIPLAQNMKRVSWSRPMFGGAQSHGELLDISQEIFSNVLASCMHSTFLGEHGPLRGKLHHLSTDCFTQKNKGAWSPNDVAKVKVK